MSLSSGLHVEAQLGSSDNLGPFSSGEHASSFQQAFTGSVHESGDMVVNKSEKVLNFGLFLFNGEDIK